MKMNLPVHHRGEYLHGDFVLLDNQFSLPDGSSGHERLRFLSERFTGYRSIAPACAAPNSAREAQPKVTHLSCQAQRGIGLARIVTEAASRIRIWHGSCCCSQKRVVYPTWRQGRGRPGDVATAWDIVEHRIEESRRDADDARVELRR